jgi:hypothetical protein
MNLLTQHRGASPAVRLPYRSPAPRNASRGRSFEEVNRTSNGLVSVLTALYQTCSPKKGTRRVQQNTFIKLRTDKHSLGTRSRWVGSGVSHEHRHGTTRRCFGSTQMQPTQITERLYPHERGGRRMRIRGRYRFVLPLMLTLGSCGTDEEDTLSEPDVAQGAVGKPDVAQVKVSNPEAGRDARSDLSPFAQALADAGVPGACGNCVKSECFDSMSDCANDPKCVDGFACTMMQCMTTLGQAQSITSTAGLGCTMACFQNDLSAALLAGSSATCIQSTCEAQCSALLSGDAGRDAEASPSHPTAPDAGPDAAMGVADASGETVSAQGSAADATDDATSKMASDASSTSKSPSDAAAEASKKHR